MEKGTSVPDILENLPSSIWAQAWATLYNCFGERLQQDELELMNAIFGQVIADKQEEIKWLSEQKEVFHGKGK